MADTERPQKPNYLLFSSKRIGAKAIPGSIQFAPDSKGGMQVAMDFAILADQRATIYSAPADMKGANGAKVVEGDFALIPQGTAVRMYSSFTGKAREYTLDKLRTSGWQGPAPEYGPGTLKRLGSGQFDGLGEAEVTITVDVNENDKDGNWLMLGEGDKRRFAPQMRVGFVNRVGGAAFKEVASLDALDALDRELSTFKAGPKTSAASTPKDGAPPANPEDLPF